MFMWYLTNIESEYRLLPTGLTSQHTHYWHDTNLARYVIKWVSSSHTETDRHAHTQKFPQALATKEWKKDTIISQKREHMDSKLEED